MSSLRISFHARAQIALHYSLRLLIVLTLVLLVWNHYGMNRTFAVGPESGHKLLVNDDRKLGGGTVGDLKSNGTSSIMDCQVVAKFDWPYCSLSIQMVKQPDGLDLSEYDSITFDISYSGPGPNSVRFYMRNYEDGISNMSDPQSLKVNGIEFEIPPNGKVTVPMKVVQVASWWVANKKINLQHTDMRIDKVPYVELQTATHVRPGMHRIEMKSIHFNGKWISEARLLRWLTRAWLLFGICRLIVELLDFRANLRGMKNAVLHLLTALHSKRNRIHQLNNAPVLITSTAPQTTLENRTLETVSKAASMEDASTNPKSSAEIDQESIPDEEHSHHPELSSPVLRTPYLKWMSAMVGNSLRVIPVDDILYFQSDQKYTRVVMAESEVLIKKTLKDLMAELDPEQFWRIHRSIMVNALVVASIEPDTGGRLAVKLKNRRERLAVSDTFVKKMRQLCA